MPRRRPAALRAEHPAPRALADAPWRQIDGLSQGANIDIRRAERLATHPDLYLGATAQAFRRYRAFTHTPGRRTLYPQHAVCPCPGCDLDDVRHARDVLAEALHRLPPRSRTELGRQVAALDALYLRRTLPDPFADRRPWDSDRWWHRRLAGGPGEA